jgi:hypothetical protein
MEGAWEPAPRFNHMYTLAFEVVSHHPTGDDVKPLKFRKAIMERMKGLDEDKAWGEALGYPDDTYEVEDD